MKETYQKVLSQAPKKGTLQTKKYQNQKPLGVNNGPKVNMDLLEQRRQAKEAEQARMRDGLQKQRVKEVISEPDQETVNQEMNSQTTSQQNPNAADSYSGQEDNYYPEEEESGEGYSDPRLDKIEGNISALAKAVCDVSKTATTAIDQVAQIGALLNNQIIPVIQQALSGAKPSGDNGSSGQGQGQGQGLSQEEIAQMMASGQIPNPGNGNNGTGVGMGGYGQQPPPTPGIGGYNPNAPGRAIAGLLDRIVQAIPLLTQLQGMRQQPDPKAIFMHNFSESIEMLKAVIGMADQLKKSVTTDLGMVEKAASVGKKVKDAVKKG